MQPMLQVLRSREQRRSVPEPLAAGFLERLKIFAGRKDPFRTHEAKIWKISEKNAEK